MNLEDTHLDVLLKAQKAQGITDRDLVKLAENMRIKSQEVKKDQFHLLQEQQLTMIQSVQT
jgi:hypothetical protein